MILNVIYTVIQFLILITTLITLLLTVIPASHKMSRRLKLDVLVLLPLPPDTYFKNAFCKYWKNLDMNKKYGVILSVTKTILNVGYAIFKVWLIFESHYKKGLIQDTRLIVKFKLTRQKWSIWSSTGISIKFNLIHTYSDFMITSNVILTV